MIEESWRAKHWPTVSGLHPQRRAESEESIEISVEAPLCRLKNHRLCFRGNGPSARAGKLLHKKLGVGKLGKGLDSLVLWK